MTSPLYAASQSRSASPVTAVRQFVQAASVYVGTTNSQTFGSAELFSGVRWLLITPWSTKIATTNSTGERRRQTVTSAIPATTIVFRASARGDR